MKFRLSSLNGAWTADAQVVSKSGSDFPATTALTEKDSEWLAIDPLRRPRLPSGATPPRVVPRTWLALARLVRLSVELPSPPGERQTMEMDFDGSTPVPCVLDTPAVPPLLSKDYVLDATAAAFTLEITLDSLARLPAWVKAIRLRRAVGETAGVARVATLEEVFTNVFGAAKPASGDRLTLDADGFAFTGNRPVPWWDAKKTRSARFRLAIDRTGPAPAYRLVAEKSPEWLDSLRRFQAAIVAATVRPRGRDGLALPGTTSVGLCAAPLPRELAWSWKAGAWVFDPGPSLFEIELRGVADGVARWEPAAIAMEVGTTGMMLRCSSTAPVGASAGTKYAFESDGTTVREDSWRADFQLAPIPESLSTILLGTTTASPARRAWILTETGPLAVPFDPPPPKREVRAVPHSVLSGVLSLCEVPWKVADETDPSAPLTPDWSGIRSGRIFVLGASAALATFRFNDKLALTRIDLTLDGVSARAEECLPLYVPPPRASNAGPPPLPRPEEAGPSRFHDLPLEQQPGVNPVGTTRIGLQIEFRPGRSASDARREGVWAKRDLRLWVGQASEPAVYWFRPAGLRWLPSLPWFGDPRARQDGRICAERTYLPLEARTDVDPVVLGVGRSWLVPRMISGSFEAPRLLDPEGTPSRRFAWVTTDLPGMAFGLVPGTRLTIRKGRPAAGKLEWILRAGLPLLDELHALRVLDAASADGGDDLERDDSWWRRLVALSSLAQARRDVLFRTEVELREDTVVRETDRRVEVRNLYAAQAFAGRASVDVLAPRASVGLDAADGTLVPLIAPDRLLEGPTCRFGIARVPDSGSPVLVPSAAAASTAPVEMRAASLAPHVVEGGRLVFDQSGRISAPVATGRAVTIPSGGPTPAADTPAGALEPFFQWTREVIDLRSDGAALALSFVAVPVGRIDGRWVFTRDGRGDADDVLRDFRWATIGAARILDWRFQVMRLERIEFPAGAAVPTDPSAIEISGVLHPHGDARIRLADEETQMVRVRFVRTDAQWQVERVEGHVLWPIYAATPDGAEATAEDVGDPLPWIEGPVEWDRTSSRPRLRIGTAATPALFVFRFLDRTWGLPIDLATGEGAPTWQVRSSPRVGAAALHATGGSVGLQQPASIDLEVTIAPGDGAPLVDVDLTLSITKRGSSVRLRGARFLTSSDTTQLAAVADAELRISSGRLTLAANVSAGFRAAADFDLLPGWPVDPTAPLYAWVDAGFATPAAGRTSSVAVADAQVLIETSLRTPDRLAALVTYAIPPGSTPRFEIRLSGRLRADSAVSWPTADNRGRWTHEVVFHLHQARIPGDRLSSGTGSFFALRFLKDPEGLAGMVEIPCLAYHRISREEGNTRKVVVAWTAAQRLRLGAPESFLEEIAMRGTRRIEALAVSKRIIEHEWLQYRATAEIEQGFVGPLGDALAATLRGTATTVLEASEAFWLRFAKGGARARGRVPLWKDGAVTVGCRPTRDEDFVAYRSDELQDWLRVPMPFLSDSRGILRNAAAAAPTGELARLLANIARRRPDPAAPRPPAPVALAREKLIHRRDLERYSLESRPIPPGPGAPVDQVLLLPDAYERLLPFVRAMAGFEPGWLVFAAWTPGTSLPDFAVPFAASAEAFGPLLDVATTAGTPECYAATEAAPAARGTASPWRRVLDSAGYPVPFLIPSPAIDMDTAVESESVPATGEKEVRILVETWQPVGVSRMAGDDPAPRLLGRGVFRFALRAGDTWSSLLQGNPSRPETNRLRGAPRRWLQVQRGLGPAAFTLLVRARTLVATADLPSTAYLLLDPSHEPIPVARARRDRLAPRVAARPDPRLDLLAEAPPPDPLVLGPDYRGGRVFYEPRAVFVPAVPELDLTGSGNVVRSFASDRDLVDPGQEVTLSWEVGPSQSLVITSKDGAFTRAVDPGKRGDLKVRAVRSTIYVLRALDPRGNVIDFRELAVRVREPAAGSAVGLGYKIAGTGPGPRHPSRLPRSDPHSRGRRWIEIVRDLLFVDRTRDTASRYEPGWYLPATRRLPEHATLAADLRPFLPTYVTHLFTAGRPGDFMRVRASILAEDREGWLLRSASFAHELRHPRPVPLPPELEAFHPAAPGRTTWVEPQDPSPPFLFAALEWQDPIYNRRLLAVAQEAAGEGLTLVLDRTLYAGVDVLYPEVRLQPRAGMENWTITLTMSLQRQEALRPLTIERLTRQFRTHTEACRAPEPAAGLPKPWRWVLEVGLDQDPDPKRPFDHVFDVVPRNQDEILVEALLEWTEAGVARSRTVSLRGRVRTDIQVWPQPQAAYGILRRRAIGQAPELVAFGWLPKPAIIRREDRFRPESWAGTFRYLDAWVADAGEAAVDSTYDVDLVTAYGEQRIGAAPGAAAT
jgi:hypothetical protein